MSRLTSENAAWRDRVVLAEPEPLRFASADGTAIEGWLLRPPDAIEGARYPLIVRVHGGPVAQYDWSFSYDLQYLAAQRYAVLTVNPRGSSGYGEEFARAIWADWGNRDAADVRAGVDHLIERDVIDRERIGVGGWSYGGILTNYLITQDPRFVAAVSGASETHYLSAYGTDDLQRWWEDELGLPYDAEARARYERLSPIYRVEEIRAATLLMVGEHDWRVPASQSEMLYTWLRRRQEDGGPPTGLVIYPGESHALRRPSFLLDRWRRTTAWFDRYVKGDASVDPFFGEDAW
jgi:dipeptidyl aminopeptidase/acylaminoacyl peptidase